MAVFVGLDCGGSSSRVLAIDETGNPLFRGQGGAANLLSTPERTVAQSLSKATDGCPSPDAVCGCFAGLVDDEVRATAVAHLKTLFPNARSLRAEPDYAAALAACGPETAACVIAGTGSVVCSWDQDRIVKTGGRGPILGDPGSASHIGSRALSAFLDDPDAFSKAFQGAVQTLFGDMEERQVVRRLYTASSPAAQLAKLAGPAAEEAKTNASLRSMIAQEMKDLASLARRHLSGRLAASKRVGLSGGLWKTDPQFRTLFEASLCETMKFEVFVLKKAPVEGAAMLAREAALVH